MDTMFSGTEWILQSTAGDNDASCGTVAAKLCVVSSWDLQLIRLAHSSSKRSHRTR